jgi:ABC-type multidrug transport system fused ATPase/permease subunit
VPRLFYQAFIRDSCRLYRAMPKNIRLTAWLVLGGQILTALTETLTLMIISLFAVTISAPESVAKHFLLQPVLSFWPPLLKMAQEPKTMVILASSLMIAFIAIKCCLACFTTFYASRLAEKISAETARRVLANFLAQDYAWHLKPEHQDNIQTVLNRGQLSLFVLQNLLFYSNIFTCLALFISLAVIEPRLTLLVVLVFGLASLLVYGLVRHQLDKSGQKVQKYFIRESHEVRALSQGIRELIIYGRRKTALDRIAGFCREAASARAFLPFSTYIPSQVLEVVGFGTIGLVVVFLIAAGRDLASIVASTSILMLSAWRILPAVNRSLSYSVALRGLRAQAMAGLNLIEKNPPAEESERLLQPEASPAAGRPAVSFQSDLKLENISFAYPSGTEPVLHNLSLTIPKGCSAGLIGLSGSGKTTLALLLSGLVSPQKGRFLVDGQELSPDLRESYFQLLGYVPQNPLLLDGTLADNVAFSRWGQAPDEERLRKAVLDAAIDFASGPEGLSQPVTSGTQTLSGGQAQRVAIARALYGQPQILIFDEATSALDLASENIIKSTLARLRGRLTAVIIAHHLSAVENCDILFWIDSGTLKMSGPPAEVIPPYRKAMDSLSRARDPRNQPDHPAPPEAGPAA